MLAYLSDEWFDHAEAALQQSESLRVRSKGLQFSLHQVVSGTPQGDVEYTMQFDDGQIRLIVGPDALATVSFTTDHATAASIAAGTVTSQEAFQSGRLQVGGNIGTLLGMLDVLVDVGDVLSPLRATTVFGAVEGNERAGDA